MRLGLPVLLAAACALGCACSRTEEPNAPSLNEPFASVPAATSAGAPSATTSAVATSGGASAGAAGAVASSGCLVPFDTPAPIASKAAHCPRDPTGNLKLPFGRVTFVDAPNQPSARVELARDEASRERGLMYRTDMPEDQGMLFSWQDERVRNFWMRNTCIPLDMLYITKEGVIAGILEQVPTLSDTPRGVRCPVAHVLELNAGWARAHGLKPGMKVTIDG